MRLNNKGFTLVEVLAVIVILSVLGGIAVMGVLSSINNSKDSSYKILINNIVSASNNLYEEVSNSYYTGSDIYQYSVEFECSLDEDGTNTDESTCSTRTDNKIKIDDGIIETNLQTLVSNGFLSGVNNGCISSCDKLSSDDKENCIENCSNQNGKILLNPRDKEDMGGCIVFISKCGVMVNNSENKSCPSEKDFMDNYSGKIEYVENDDEILEDVYIFDEYYPSSEFAKESFLNQDDGKFILNNFKELSLDNYDDNVEYKFMCENFIPGSSCTGIYEVDWDSAYEVDGNLLANVKRYYITKKVTCNK